MAVNYFQKFVEGEVYHLYNRSPLNVILFKDDLDYNTFLNKFKKFLGPFFNTYAYCLIPNHFHFLVRVKTSKDIDMDIFSNSSTVAFEKFNANEIGITEFIEDQMRRFFSSVALSYNYKYKRRGSVFDGRLKRIAVQNDSKLQYLLCYIHHNPIHHGLVDRYRDWKFLSYNDYISGSMMHEERGIFTKLYFNKNETETSKVFDMLHQDFKVDYHEDLNMDRIK